MPVLPDSLVFIIDDDASVRRALGRLLASAGYPFETFASARAFLARTPYPGPCCIILDFRMPGCNGLELQKNLAAAGREEQIIFITGHGDIPTCADAMKAGAIDFLPKPFRDGELLGAVARSLDRAGRLFRESKERAEIQTRIDRLTPREREVMQLVIAGKLNKNIADELEASEKTIKVHRGRVMQKMQVFSVAELVRLTEKVGIHPPATGDRTKV